MAPNEQYFDFMAAGEETAKQMDAMVRRLPEVMKTSLLQEWQQSPWRSEPSRIFDEVRVALADLAKATRLFRLSVWIAAVVTCCATLVIPFSTWFVADMYVADLKKERAELQNEVAELTHTASALAKETGDGARLFQQDDGARVFVLPHGSAMTRTFTTRDGRVAVIYE